MPGGISWLLGPSGKFFLAWEKKKVGSPWIKPSKHKQTFLWCSTILTVDNNQLVCGEWCHCMWRPGLQAVVWVIKFTCEDVFVYSLQSLPERQWPSSNLYVNGHLYLSQITTAEVLNKWAACSPTICFVLTACIFFNTLVSVFGGNFRHK